MAESCKYAVNMSRSMHSVKDLQSFVLKHFIIAPWFLEYANMCSVFTVTQSVGFPFRKQHQGKGFQVWGSLVCRHTWYDIPEILLNCNHNNHHHHHHHHHHHIIVFTVIVIIMIILIIFVSVILVEVYRAKPVKKLRTHLHLHASHAPAPNCSPPKSVGCA